MVDWPLVHLLWMAFSRMDKKYIENVKMSYTAYVHTSGQPTQVTCTCGKQRKRESARGARSYKNRRWVCGRQRWHCGGTSQMLYCVKERDSVSAYSKVQGAKRCYAQAMTRSLMLLWKYGQIRIWRAATVKVITVKHYLFFIYLPIRYEMSFCRIVVNIASAWRI